MRSTRLAAVFCAGLVGTTVLAGTTSAHAADTVERPGDWVAYTTEVIAHRGKVTSKYPDNTPASLRDAFENGAKAVEFDVISTKDKRLVVMHDGDLDKNTTNCSGQVKDRSYDYVRKCKTKDGAQAPNLYDMLKVVRDNGGRAYVHVKTGKGYAESYLNAANKYGLNRNGHVVFYSSMTDSLDELRKEGAASVGLTFTDKTAKAGWASKYPMLFPYDTKLTAELVRKAQARGQAVVPTESPRISIDDARKYGVDGFMANNFAAASAALH